MRFEIFSVTPLVTDGFFDFATACFFPVIFPVHASSTQGAKPPAIEIQNFLLRPAVI